MFHSKIFRYAIKLAQNAPSNEVPVSAVIAIGSKIVSVATNNAFATGKDWYHAEYIAVLKAMHSVARHISEASIYVTLEPCIFCSALLEKVRIGYVYFGAYNFEKPALTECLPKFPYLNNNVSIVGGIYEQVCHNMLKNFFKRMRSNERN